MSTRVHPQTDGDGGEDFINTQDGGRPSKEHEVLSRNQSLLQQDGLDDVDMAGETDDGAHDSKSKTKQPPPPPPPGGNRDKALPHKSFVAVLFFQNFIGIFTLIAIIAALSVGLILKSAIQERGYWTMRRMSYVQFVGEVFVNMLHCMIIPLITSTMIAAIGSMDMKVGRFIAFRGFALFAVTTLISILIGLLLAYFLGPGRQGSKTDYCKSGSVTLRSISVRRSGSSLLDYLDHHPGGANTNNNNGGLSDWEILNENNGNGNSIIYGGGGGGPGSTFKTGENRGIGLGRQGVTGANGTNGSRAWKPCLPYFENLRCKLPKDTILDSVRALFPPNIVEASLERIITIPDFSTPNSKSVKAYKNCEDYRKSKINEEIEDYGLKKVNLDGTNIIGLIIFSVVLGIAALNAGDIGLPLMNFFISFSKVTYKMTYWVICISPIGIFSLVLGHFLRTPEMGSFLISLLFYFGTVILGLLIHSVIILPLLYIILTRKSPFRLYMDCQRAILTSFQTASSTATIPTSMRCLEENAKIDSRVLRFLIPSGGEINFNGHGLFEIVTVIYISQIHGLQLDIADCVVLVIMSFVASIGTVGIPSGGLFTLTIVLNSVGLESTDISIILLVEFILDRCASVTNLIGDIVVTAITHHCSTSKLEELTRAEEAARNRKEVLEIERPKVHTDKEAQTNDDALSEMGTSIQDETVSVKDMP